MQVERAKKRKVITRSKPPEGNEAGNMVASVAKAKRGPIMSSTQAVSANTAMPGRTMNTSPEYIGFRVIL